MDSDEKSTIADPDDVAWVTAQRERVIQYLKFEKVEHGGVSLEPRWFLSPYIAIWAVRSDANQSYIGWWAISGDLPTDYVTRRHEKNDADVLLAFAEQWRQRLPKWRWVGIYQTTPSDLVDRKKNLLQCF